MIFDILFLVSAAFEWQCSLDHKRPSHVDTLWLTARSLPDNKQLSLVLRLTFIYTKSDRQPARLILVAGHSILGFVLAYVVQVKRINKIVVS